MLLTTSRDLDSNKLKCYFNAEILPFDYDFTPQNRVFVQENIDMVI